MTPTIVDAGGLQYLDLITSLMHRVRLADADAGIWEAADLQWWWRRDVHADASNARFWLDGAGAPMAAVVVTDWGDSYGLDVIASPTADVQLSDLWDHAADRAGALSLPVEIAVRTDDPETRSFAVAAGFQPTTEGYVECAMAAEDRPAIAALADGYRLTTRASCGDRPHHMIGRSGPNVAERLAQCSLYRPELDLLIETDDGETAAYGLFWADPVTGVGLVEPMRTEDDHQRKGLGRHVLTTGLDLLADAGCTRLRISYLDTNDTARRLYLGVGFRSTSTSSMLVRSAV